ncbi:MAG: hypothetical protein M1398_07090 [Deltaproteobacteria bacterium]|nr:hypothetical protein [Deltaproteobacteria bacterium]MDA8308116.1 hypothetical protein [Deltaproteobacteria bacterium]
MNHNCLEIPWSEIVVGDNQEIDVAFLSYLRTGLEKPPVSDRVKSDE